MRKRIFRFMSLIILLSVFLLILFWGVGLHNEFRTQIRHGLENLRITLIEENGEVSFDNVAGQRPLDNHGNRPEVIEARQKGHGESERYSDTLSETTYYYAVKIPGDKILRLALTTRSLSALLGELVPMILLCVAIVLLIAFVSAKWLTEKIMAPIGSLNVDGANRDAYKDAYDELLPFVRKIERQKEEISGHCADREDQANMTRAITESMKEGLVLVDAKGRVRSLNKSASGIFGVREVENKDVHYLHRNRDFLGAVRGCLAGGNAEMDLEKDGRIYAVYMHPVYSCGAVNGALILLLDRTEKRKAEEQRREFSANVSHELKTPLTAISALSEMMANDLLQPEDIKGFGQKIFGQVRRLIGIIDDIIRLSAFDEGKVDRTFASFDVRELARSVLVSLKEKADARRVTLELEGESLNMTGNERMIDELLYNLVDNAIKYNVDGGRVTVFLAERDGGPVISVKDTGIGIAGEHQSRIFERFYRVDQARSRAGGAGLGLAIVKHAVEHHGGRIALESDEKGTTITCCFKEKIIRAD